MLDIRNGRCGWCSDDKVYQDYHDFEWGKLVTDDKVLFEFLVLESAQAGLSWITILKKREGYREAFHNFDVQKVAMMTEIEQLQLQQFDGIVRNKLKIKATVTNAQAFIVIQKEFGSFSNYLKSFTTDEFPIINNWKALREVPASTPLSDAISNDMKKRGFKFFGTTICYAFLQAVGYIDDHLIDCVCRKGVVVSKN